MSSNQPPENPSSDPAAEPAQLAEELLPPVEPPDAGFLLQLFVIPAVIVLAVVLLWLLVTTLASSGAQDPDKIVKALRSSNPSRWQQAKELADMLRLPERYPELKSNAELADQLAQLLDEQIDAELTDDNSIQLRIFLCSALGEFHVDSGLGVLLKAARLDGDLHVRRQAINALAVLAHSFNTMESPQILEHEKLISTFSQLADDEEDLIRSQAAYALGVFAMQPDADSSFTMELESLVEDLFLDARYNAALALARQGNERATEALVEMLDPEAIQLSISKVDSPVLESYLPALQAFKRNTILRNALDGMNTLIEKNTQADRQSLLAAVSQFVENADDWEVAGELPQELVEHAQEILQKHAPDE